MEETGCNDMAHTAEGDKASYLSIWGDVGKQPSDIISLKFRFVFSGGGSIQSFYLSKSSNTTV